MKSFRKRVICIALGTLLALSPAADVWGIQLQNLAVPECDPTVGRVSTPSDAEEKVEDPFRATESDATQSDADELSVILTDDVNQHETHYRNWQADSSDKNYNYEVLDLYGDPVDQTFWNYEWEEELQGWRIEAMSAEISYDGQEWEYVLYHDDGTLKTEIPAVINQIPVVSMSRCFAGAPLTICPELPDTVRFMDYAFERSGLMEMPDLPEEVTSLEGTFMGCANLTDMTIIPSSVTNMNQTFSSSGIIATPEFPETIHLDDLPMTFSNCRYLSQVGELPAVKKMTNTFQGSFPPEFDAETGVVLPEGVEEMTGTFSYSGVGSPAKLPPSVKTIDYCYQVCSYLKRAPLMPEGLQSAEGAFRFCGQMEYTDGSDYIVLPGSLSNCHEMFSSTFGAGVPWRDKRRSQLIFIQDRDHYQQIWNREFGTDFTYLDLNGDYLLDDGEPIHGEKELLTVAPFFTADLCVHDDQRALRLTFKDFYPNDFHLYPMDVILYSVDGSGFEVWDRKPVYLTEDSYVEVKKIRSIETYEGIKEIEGEVRGKWFRVSQPEIPVLEARYTGKGIYEVTVSSGSRSRSLEQEELFYHVDQGIDSKISNYGKARISCGQTITAYADWGAKSETVSWTAPPYVSSITISGLEDRYIGIQNLPLICHVEKEDAGDKNVIWSIEGESGIACIEEDMLKSTGYGKITVIAEAADGGGASDRKTVEFVEDVEPSGLRVYLEDDHPPYLTTGENVKLVVEILPENAVDKRYTVNVSDPAVLKAQKDDLTALSPGEVVLTVTASNGVTGELKLWINDPVQGITCKFIPSIVDYGQSAVMVIDTDPRQFGEEEYYQIEFGSTSLDLSDITTICENQNNFRVFYGGEDGGVLEASVTIKGNGPQRAEAKLVIRPKKNQEFLTITPKISALYIEERKKLTVNQQMDGMPPVRWGSGDPDVVTVSGDGTMKGIKEGKTRITASADSIYGGTVSDSMIIEVKKQETQEIQALSVAGSHDIDIGENLQLTLIRYPENSIAEVVWTSSDQNVLTVDQTGLVKGIAPGVAAVTAYSREFPEVRDEVGIGVIDKKHTQVSIHPRNQMKLYQGMPATVKNGFGEGKIFFDAEVTTWQDNKKVIWTVESRGGDGTVSDKGVFTPVKNGRVVITAAAACDSSAIDSFEMAVVTRTEDILWHFEENEGNAELYMDGVSPADAMTDGIFLKSCQNEDLYFVTEPGKVVPLPAGWVPGSNASDKSLVAAASNDPESLLYYEEPVYHGNGQTLYEEEFLVTDPRGLYSLSELELEQGYPVNITARNGMSLPAGLLNGCEEWSRRLTLVPMRENGGITGTAVLTERIDGYYLEKLSGFSPEFEDSGGYRMNVNLNLMENDGGNLKHYHLSGANWYLIESGKKEFTFRTLNGRGNEVDSIVCEMQQNWDEIQYDVDHETEALEPWRKAAFIMLDVDSDIGYALPSNTGWENYEEMNPGGEGLDYLVSLYDEEGKRVQDRETAMPVRSVWAGRDFPAVVFFQNGKYRIKVTAPNGSSRYRDVTVSGIDGITHVQLKKNTLDSFEERLSLIPVIYTEKGMESAGTYETEVEFPDGWEKDVRYNRVELKGNVLCAKGLIPDQDIVVILTLKKEGKKVFKGGFKIMMSNQTPSLEIWPGNSELYEGEIYKVDIKSKTAQIRGGYFVQQDYDLNENDLILTVSDREMDFDGRCHEGISAFPDYQWRGIQPGRYFVTSRFSDELFKYYTEEEKQEWLDQQNNPSFTVKEIPQKRAVFLTLSNGDLFRLGKEYMLEGKIITNEGEEAADISNSEITIEELSGKGYVEKVRNGYELVPEASGYLKVTLTPIGNGKLIQDSVIIKLVNPVTDIFIRERDGKTFLYEGEQAFYSLVSWKPYDADPFETEWRLEDCETGSTLSEDGQLTAGNAGHVILCAAVKGADTIVSDEIDLEIRKKEKSEFRILPKEAVIKDDERFQMSYELVPDDAGTGEVIWSVEEDGAGITADGIFIPRRPGIYHINAAAQGEEQLEDSALIDVRAHKKIIRITSGDSMECGSRMTLTAQIDPEDSEVKEIVWTLTTEDNLAYLDGDDLVSGEKSGKVRLRATIQGTEISDEKDIFIGNHQFELEVEIRDEDGKLCSETDRNGQVYLYVNQQACAERLLKGQQYEVTAVLNAEGHVIREFGGEILDPSGRIRIKNTGDYRITVKKQGEELEDSAELRVTENSYDALKIIPEDGTYTICPDEVKKMGYQLYPALREGDEVIWEAGTGSPELNVTEDGAVMTSGNEGTVFVVCRIVRKEDKKEYLRQLCGLTVRKKNVPEAPDDPVRPDPDETPDSNGPDTGTEPDKGPDTDSDKKPDKDPDTDSEKGGNKDTEMGTNKEPAGDSSSSPERNSNEDLKWNRKKINNNGSIPISDKNSGRYSNRDGGLDPERLSSLPKTGADEDFLNPFILLLSLLLLADFLILPVNKRKYLSKSGTKYKIKRKYERKD